MYSVLSYVNGYNSYANQLADNDKIYYSYISLRCKITVNLSIWEARLELAVVTRGSRPKIADRSR